MHSTRNALTRGRTDHWCYLFTVPSSGLLFFHVADLALPISLSFEKGTLSPCDLEL